MLRTMVSNQKYNAFVFAIISLICIYELYSLKLFSNIPPPTKHYAISRKLTEILESIDNLSLKRESQEWPPNDIQVLQDMRTGFYDMRIRPKVKFNGTKMDSIQAYVHYLKDRYEKSAPKGSEVKRSMWMNEKTRDIHAFSNYKLYPQALDLSTVIEAVESGNYVNQVSDRV